MLRMTQRGMVMNNWQSVAADYAKHADTAEASFGTMGEYNAAFHGGHGHHGPMGDGCPERRAET